MTGELLPWPIIGLSGRARAGKDTVAERLVEAYGFKRFALADNVRTMAYAVDPLVFVEQDERGPLRFSGPQGQGLGFVSYYTRLSDLVDEVGWERAKAVRDVRRFLQRLGTEGVRDVIGDNAWIDALQKQIAEDDHLGGVVITDVRFENEADWLTLFGWLWRVDRASNADVVPHSSETALDNYEAFDVRLQNDGSIEELWEQVDIEVSNIRERAFGPVLV